MPPTTSWRTVDVDECNRKLRTDKANVMQGNSSIQPVKCVVCINQEDGISIVRFEEPDHSVYRSFDT
jgi:hypothetical protein